MIVVIFRARIRKLDAEYQVAADRMRELGRARWYESCAVQVATISREYSHGE